GTGKLKGRADGARARYPPLFITTKGRIWPLASIRPTRSENRYRINRRARTAFDGKRRELDHELIAVQPPRSLHKVFQIQALDDVDAHPVQHGDMDRIAHAFPTGARIPVDVEIMADERRQPVVHPGDRVGIIAGDLARPRPDRIAALPPA